MATDASRESRSKYQHERTKSYTIKVVKDTERDVYERLEMADNVSGYLKSLVLRDIYGEDYTLERETRDAQKYSALLPLERADLLELIDRCWIDRSAWADLAAATDAAINSMGDIWKEHHAIYRAMGKIERGMFNHRLAHAEAGIKFDFDLYRKALIANGCDKMTK